MSRKLDLRSIASSSVLFPLASMLLLACEGAITSDFGDESPEEAKAESNNVSPDEQDGGTGGLVQKSDAGVGPGGAGGGAGGAGGIAVGGAGGGGVAAGGSAGTNMMGGAPGAGGKPVVEEPPAGSVEMFVAVGVGGRRIMSCDGGRTWIADQRVAAQSEDNEHQPYTPKGLAYGNGTFIFLTGWGTASTTWASTDGISWTQKKHETSYGGIGYSDGGFIAVGQNYLSKSTDKGATWTRLSTPKAPYNRENAAFDGILASGSDGQVVTLRTGANTWSPLSGCVGNRHGGIGKHGGYAAGLGVMISIAEDGNTCGINIASGVHLNPGRISAAIAGKPSFVGDAIWMASGDKIHSTTDGSTWVSRALATGVRFEHVARSASGTYAAAAASGAAFFYSDDGQRWTKAMAPMGNGITTLVAGSGSPSAQCPWR